jgi:hypothetical protein
METCLRRKNKTSRRSGGGVNGWMIAAANKYSFAGKSNTRELQGKMDCRSCKMRRTIRWIRFREKKMNLGMHKNEKRIEHVEIETENMFQSVRGKAKGAENVQSSKPDKIKTQRRNKKTNPEGGIRVEKMVR